MADAARDGEAQEVSPLPSSIYAFSMQDCKRIVQAVMSPCQVQRGGIKDRYNITLFPLGCVDEKASKRLRNFFFF